ncbi:hypothetical protein OHW85_20955, partial [Acinetobacter baumannii]|nr:hypothetical protein [Acinetobacter baumannii]
YEGQQVITQFNASNGLQPIPLNMSAPINPNLPNNAQQQSNVDSNRIIELETENSQLKAQLNTLRDIAQHQQLNISQLRTLIKNNRANQGKNVVTLRETKKGIPLNKALPAGSEVIAVVGNRVWLNDGRNTTSYGVGQKLPTGARVLDVNEMAGEASFK